MIQNILRASRRFAPATEPVTMDVGRGLLSAKAYYFFLFGAFGSLLPFLNVHFQNQGLTGAQIGLVNSVAPLIALTANPFWGAIADRWQLHRAVMALCAVAAGVSALAFLGASGFWSLMAVVVVMAFFRTPIPALLDNTTMSLVKRAGASYGRQRMWGSVAFVAASYGLGQLLAVDDLRPVFVVYGVALGVGCGGLSLLLPIQRSHKQVNILVGLRELVGRPGYVSFLGAVMLLGMGMSCVFTYMGLHVLALGGDGGQLGLVYAATGITEIPILYMGARWFARYRYSRLLLVGFIGFVVTWAALGLAQSPLILILLMPVNGILFGMFWVAVVGFASDTAPEGLGATAQALVGAAQSGLGISLGALLGGYLWDTIDGHAVFFAAATAVTLAAIIFWLGNRRQL